MQRRARDAGRFAQHAGDSSLGILMLRCSRKTVGGIWQRLGCVPRGRLLQRCARGLLDSFA
eukprot:12287430-Alexandrium_andersonii.AAC.1